MNRHFWEEGSYALLPAACGIGMQSVVFMRGNVISWWEKQKKPRWVIRNRLVNLVLDICCPGSFGFGAYVVQRRCVDPSGSDLKWAMGLYGSSLILGGVSIAVLSHWNHVKWAPLASYSLLLVCTTGTVICFWRISKEAGLLALPWSVWIGMSTALLYYFWRNPSDEE